MQVKQKIRIFQKREEKERSFGLALAQNFYYVQLNQK